jgi:hypothetical protein
LMLTLIEKANTRCQASRQFPNLFSLKSTTS